MFNFYIIQLLIQSSNDEAPQESTRKIPQSTKHKKRKDTIVMLIVVATGIVKTKREHISLSIVDINFKSYPAV